MSEKTIAFLGPLGTHSHRATQEIFGQEFNAKPEKTFDQVFEVLASNQADAAVVPLENNTAGVVDVALDLLIRSEFSIIAEFNLEIQHSLLSNEKGLSEIKTLYSLSQPYFQCQNFILNYLPHAKWVQEASSAGAIEACLRNPKNSAAIGYADSGRKIGVPVFQESIQDLSNNETRFVVLSNGVEPKINKNQYKYNKTSIVFTLEDKPGTLLKIMSIFNQHNLNLCHIESRPTRLEEWRYYFCITVESEPNDKGLEAALKEVSSHVLFYKHLGTYPIIY